MKVAATSQERNAERRWIVLVEDGRFSTLGRASDPSEQEILDTEAALTAQAVGGWLCVMQGNPYVGDAPHLMEVRPLGRPTTPFESAAAACVASILERRSQLGS